MEEFSFDISSGLLSAEEAEKLFDETKPLQEPEEPEEETEQKQTPTEEEETPSEKVGTEDEREENAISPKGDGPSPLSSIATALKKDGIFPEFSDEELNAANTPEAFAELVERTIQSRLDERQKRIDEALGNGIAPDTVKMYEETLSYLGSITEEALKDESEQGENLRKQLIFNDLINRGYTQEKAMKELEKSFKSATDIEDATDALSALTNFYQQGYQNIQQEAKKKVEDAKKQRQQDEAKFRKMVLEDEIVLGDAKLDKKTRQSVFDAVSKPVYKDPDTGQLLTQVQKFQKENPMEFLKQIGMWYVLTNGGKDFSGLAKQQVIAEKNKGIRELERKINSSAFDSDGSLKYMSGGQQIADDTLLNDGWQVDMKR
jgi:hypothetical protein